MTNGLPMWSSGFVVKITKITRAIGDDVVLKTVDVIFIVCYNSIEGIALLQDFNKEGVTTGPEKNINEMGVRWRSC